MERRLRVDLIIALAAVCISAIAAAAAGYQTFVINQQFSATVWPYLALNDTYEPGRVQFRLENDGLGPAIVRSANISVDGRTVNTWTTVIKSFPLPHHTHLIGSLSSVSDGEVVRAGDSKILLDLHGPALQPKAIFDFQKARRISVNICYCSLLQQCWLVHLLSEESNPRPVRTCPKPESILGV